MNDSRHWQISHSHGIYPMPASWNRSMRLSNYLHMRQELDHHLHLWKYRWCLHCRHLVLGPPTWTSLHWRKSPQMMAPNNNHYLWRSMYHQQPDLQFALDTLVTHCHQKPSFFKTWVLVHLPTNLLVNQLTVQKQNSIPHIHMAGMHSALANLECHIWAPVTPVYQCVGKLTDMYQKHLPIKCNIFSGMGYLKFISIGVRYIIWDILCTSRKIPLQKPQHWMMACAVICDNKVQEFWVIWPGLEM